MAEEELKEMGEEDTLEEISDDRSLWNEEEIGNTLPDLNRWDDMVKDLLPETHSRRKEESVRQEPVADLKAVRPKPKPPVAEVRSPELEKARIAPVSDKQLLMLIQKYKDADKICEIAQMTLQTLQGKVAHLSYLLKRYIDVEGLYRDTRPVKMTQEGILIPKGHLVDTGFKVGDLFNVGFKDNFIILARHPK
ncbi:MAG: hypothetical protein R6X27_18340 [Candidatus Desulfacyla sp.]